MSSVLESLRHTSDFVHKSFAPVDADGAAPTPGVLSGAIGSIESAVKAGSTVSIKDAPAYLDAIKNLNGVGLDDREFLLEKLVALMSALPPGSSLGKKMEQFFIDALYKDLPHPPTSFLGPVDVNPPSKANDPIKPDYAFRTDDGSNYNPAIPNLGKAGTPYARTVPSTRLTPQSALPDPGLVFDLLLKRDTSKPFEAHPGGLSSMFFALANLVIHSVFDTDHSDWRINNASSFMDLSPLYGGGKGVQTRPVEDIRRMDGTGKLWDDCFADSRLLFMPPATGALLVLLNRNHNFIAQKLLDINERSRFTDPPPQDETKRKAQDDEIFHRARLVNSGFFAKIVLHDYVGGILGMTRDCSPWRLNLTQAIRQGDHEFAPTGAGGAVSAEFNMLYRWHATTSENDEKWISKVFTGLLEGKPAGEATVEDFKKGAHKFLRPDPDIRKWTIYGLKRGDDGRYKDEELAAVIMNATEAPAHHFGARSVPEALRVVEIMSLEQSRSWGCCSLNEFRRFFGLRPYKTFKEWNSNDEVADAAQALYRDIENLELYPGLQAENFKPAMPGAGLCPGFTVSRAILADAVVLTRSDPFLTTELTPFNLSSWGFNYITPNPNDGSFGGILTKLLLQQLPTHFKPGSSYAHFPLYVPKSMQGYLKEKLGAGSIEKYNWSRPGSPGSLWTTGFAGDAYMQHMSVLVKNVKVDRDLVDDVLFSEENLIKWSKAFSKTTDDLIKERSINNPSGKTHHIDVVMDVLNIVPIRFLADEILGLPLKTEANPGGVYRDEELYEMFSDIATYLLSNYDPGEEWALRERATKYSQLIIGDIEAHLARHSPGFSIKGIIDAIKTYFTGANDRSADFVKAVLEQSRSRGRSHEEIAASLFAEIAATAAPFSAMLAADVSDALGGGENATTKRFEALADLGSDGLVNEKFIKKTAQPVLDKILSLRNLRKAKGKQGQMDSFSQTFAGSEAQFFIDNVGRVTAFPARLAVEYDV